VKTAGFWPLLIVVLVVSLVAQVADAVTSIGDWPLTVALQVKGCDPPCLTVRLVLGLIVIAVTPARTMLTVVLPLIVPEAAVIVGVQGAETAVSRPLVLTVAVASLLDHKTEPVRFFVLPSS